MTGTVTIRYRWTAEELLQANRYHFRHTCRPLFRVGLNLIAALAMVGGLGVLSDSRPLDRGQFLTSIAGGLAGVYWFTLRPLGRRWWTRRQFRKRPDKDIEVEWQVNDDELATRTKLGTSTMSWQSLAKVVCTQHGVLLYPIDQMHLWIPRSGFSNDFEFEEFVNLAKRKIERHFDVA